MNTTEQWTSKTFPLMSSNDTFEAHALSIRALTFGAMVKLATETVEHYHSDLYYDALFLERVITEDGSLFVWGFDDCGTFIAENRGYQDVVESGGKGWMPREHMFFVEVRRQMDGFQWVADFTKIEA